MARKGIFGIIPIIGFIMILLGSVTIASSIIPFTSISHNYQGPTISYEYALVDGQKITFGPEDATFISFDPDTPDDYHPDFISEHTDFIVPKITPSSSIWTSSIIPNAWKNTIVNTENPVNVYQWNITNDNGTVTSYIMEEWRAYWVIKAYVDPINTKYIWTWDGKVPAELLAENRYNNMELYFRILLNTPDRNWYFEDADRVYFAIAKIKLVDVYAEPSKEGDMKVQPKDPGTNLPLFGATYSDPLTYKGQKLNPNVFPETVETLIRFVDFGGNVINGEARTDTITMVFEVRLFVIGEWIVQNIDDVPNPDDYHYSQRIFEPLFGWTKGLGLGIGIGLLVLGLFLLTPIDELLVLGALGLIGKKRR